MATEGIARVLFHQPISSMPVFVWRSWRILMFEKKRGTWWVEGIVQQMHHKDMLSIQQNELFSSFKSVVTVVFSPLWSKHALMQQASHNGPCCSTYIIKYLLTVAWNLTELLSGIFAFTVIFHISLNCTTFLTESPRCSRYSYKTIHPSCHWHFTLTRSTEGWLKWVLSQWLSVQSFQSWDVSQLLKEHVGMGGGSFVSISVSIFLISCKNRVFHLWLLCLKMHNNEDQFHKCQ